MRLRWFLQISFSSSERLIKLQLRRRPAVVHASKNYINQNYMSNMCQKELSDSNFNQAVIGKTSIFKKLPQISQIHKNGNFLTLV